MATICNRWGGWAPPGKRTLDLVRVTEQAGSIPGLTYRSADGSTGWISANTWRATVSYVTGANSLKFGYNGAFHLDNQDSNPPTPRTSPTGSTTACRIS